MTTRARRWLTLTALVVIVCVPRVLARQDLDNRLILAYSRYLSLLDGYRHRDAARVQELSAFLEQSEREDGKPVVSFLIVHVPMPLAVLSQMALTDFALAAFDRGDEQVGRTHLFFARNWIDVNLLRADHQLGWQLQRHFGREWYRAIIWLWIARSYYNMASPLLEDARTKFPDDPELLLTSGTLAEIQLTHRRSPGAPRNAPGDLAHLGTHPTPVDMMAMATPSAPATAMSIDRTVGYFRSVLRLDPDNVEARVRLAHFLIATQSPPFEEPLRLLKEARALEPKPPLSYLAALFAGEVEERQQHLDAAATWYRTAIATCPRAQTARLALSHAQLDQSVGQTTAQNTLRPLIGGPPAVDHICEPDPWRMYEMGQAWRLDDLLMKMRNEALGTGEGSQP
jgi:tetratricopeptide (TPR) repeat protein